MSSVAAKVDTRFPRNDSSLSPLRTRPLFFAFIGELHAPHSGDASCGVEVRANPHDSNVSTSMRAPCFVIRNRSLPDAEQSGSRMARRCLSATAPRACASDNALACGRTNERGIGPMRCLH